LGKIGGGKALKTPIREDPSQARSKIKGGNRKGKEKSAGGTKKKKGTLVV